MLQSDSGRWSQSIPTDRYTTILVCSLLLCSSVHLFLRYILFLLVSKMLKYTAWSKIKNPALSLVFIRSTDSLCNLMLCVSITPVPFSPWWSLTNSHIDKTIYHRGSGPSWIHSGAPDWWEQAGFRWAGRENMNKRDMQAGSPCQPV